MAADTQAAALAFVDAHLPALAGEVVQWESTGVLPAGRLRELEGKLEHLGESMRRRVAVALVTSAALRLAAQGRQ